MAGVLTTAFSPVVLISVDRPVGGELSMGEVWAWISVSVANIKIKVTTPNRVAGCSGLVFAVFFVIVVC